MLMTETRVRISGINVAHPPLRLPQAEAARAIGALTLNPRRAAALARGTQIEQRAIALTTGEVLALGTPREIQNNEQVREVYMGGQGRE